MSNSKSIARAPRANRSNSAPATHATPREVEILGRIINSEYQHDNDAPVGHRVWGVCSNKADNAIMGSLIKKGFAGTQKETPTEGLPETATSVWVTQEGFDAFIAAQPVVEEATDTPTQAELQGASEGAAIPADQDFDGVANDPIDPDADDSVPDFERDPAVAADEAEDDLVPAYEPGEEPKDDEPTPEPAAVPEAKEEGALPTNKYVADTLARGYSDTNFRCTTREDAKLEADRLRAQGMRATYVTISVRRDNPSFGVFAKTGDLRTHDRRVFERALDLLAKDDLNPSLREALRNTLNALEQAVVAIEEAASTEVAS